MYGMALGLPSLSFPLQAANITSTQFTITGVLEAKTCSFTEATQKRYDDTSILLEIPLIEGIDSTRGKAAIRRINQMHRMYDISNDDFRYVLATFVVVPRRWLAEFGWRDLTDDEVWRRCATTRHSAST